MARLSDELQDWFPLPDDPDKSEILVKHIKNGEQNDIEDQIQLYETMLRPDADGNLQREIKLNPARGDKRYVYLCAAVRDWKNFFDLDGKPMACTDENKIRMARDDKQLGQFVGECRVILAKRFEEQREAARKNATT
ncbi:hypothetical protein K9F62_17045 [Desulfovibrio sp. JY]|nr:hypothetical protein K9F62_17045 [Desulfovibrio sp. JY]